MRCIRRINGAVALGVSLLWCSCSDDSPTNPTSNVEVCPEPEWGLFGLAVYPPHHETADWSSDGWIAYKDYGIVCLQGGGLFWTDLELVGVWILNPETQEKYQVLQGSGWHSPALSKDGRRLAVVLGGDIYTLNRDGSELQRVTNGGSNHLPSWSPDGDWLAYNSLHGNSKTDSILVTHVATGETFVVGHGMYPAWHPVDPIIVCLRRIGYSRELYAMDQRESWRPVQLTASEMDKRYPEYSPDGQWITYQGQPLVGSDRTVQVWVMKSDGTQHRKLTRCGGAGPSWSPDGTKIVYTRYFHATIEPDFNVLWLVDVETDERTQLTSPWPERCNERPVQATRGSSSWVHDKPHRWYSKSFLP